MTIEHDKSAISPLNPEGEAIFGAIFNNSEIGLVLFSPKQRRLIPNPAFAQMVGYSPDELRAGTIAAISDPDDLRAEQRLIAEVEAGTRDGYRIEKRYIHKDGRAVSTQLTVSILRDAARHIDWVVAIIEDISARKAAEAALRASEARYRSLIELQDDLVVRMLPDGTRTFVNDAYCQHLGATREQLLGTSLYQHVHPDDIEQVRRRAEIYASGGRPSIGLSRGLRADGSTCWYEWTGRGIYDAEGRLIEVQSVGRDVTDRERAIAERIELEHKLLETRQLESLGVLAGGIAHDFNNILTSVLGHAELALLSLPPGSELRRNLEQIIDGAQQAAELTRQILAYSGKGRALVRQLNWGHEIRSIASLLQVAGGPNCRLIFQIVDDLPLIEADPAQLRQIATSLVLNAAEASAGDGGEIIVATDTRALSQADLAACSFGSERPPGTYAALIVSDQGCGMDAETMAHIFEPFFSTKFTGRGLSLAAVQGIVRSHRGAIQVASRPGHGTTITIWLPAV